MKRGMRGVWQRIISEVAQREGKKSQARVYDLREAVGHLADYRRERCQKLGFDEVGIAMSAVAEDRARRKKRSWK